MPSDAEQAFLDAFNALRDTPATKDNHDRPFQAAAAVIERAIADAVEQERARIVEWLRGDNGFDTEDGLLIADAIERGSHLANEP